MGRDDAMTSKWWIDPEEDSLLRPFVTAMKRHDGDEWHNLSQVVIRQTEEMEDWDTMPFSSLERKFTIFWELIQPFAEEASVYLTSIGELEPGQRKKELQIRCIVGLTKFDTTGNSTVLGWLRRAWQFQDANVSRRKGPQNIQASTVKNSDGEHVSLIDILADFREDHSVVYERRNLMETVQECFQGKTSRYPWDVAIAVWLDNENAVDNTDSYPFHPPRARQQILREFAAGKILGDTPPNIVNHANVFFRRNLLKSLSRVIEATV